MEISKEHDPIPSYLELIYGIYNFSMKTIRDDYFSNRAPTPEEESWQYFNINKSDVIYVVLLSALFTILRNFFTEWIFTPMGKHYGLTPTNQKKMPESAWKFIHYVCAWGMSLYVLILSGRYNFFQNPSTVFDGWSLDKDTPLDIYIMYIVQSGFYTHSLYATLFLDVWRKDSIVMMIHHVLTLVLISVSYSLRYHNIGSVVLFLHDVCDIQLEFTKLNVYFKLQHGKYVWQHETLANVAFFGFTITWFVSRLYLFPLKVLYSTTAVVLQKNLILPCAISMNILLWVLQAMNIYWFMFIVNFLVRVATGQVSEVDDTRDYDVEEKFSQKLSVKLETVFKNFPASCDAETNGTAEKSPMTNGDSTIKKRL